MTATTHDIDSDHELESNLSRILEEVHQQPSSLNPWESTPRDVALQNFHKRILNYNNHSSSASDKLSTDSKDFATFIQDSSAFQHERNALLPSSSTSTSLVSRLREADLILKERREESLAVEMIRQSQYINSAKSLITDLNHLIVYLLSNLESIQGIADLDRLVTKIRNGKNKICMDFSYENKIKYLRDLNAILKLLKVQASIAPTFNQKLLKNLIEEFLPYLEDEEGKNSNSEEPSVEFLYDVTASFVSFIQSLDAYKVSETQ